MEPAGERLSFDAVAAEAYAIYLAEGARDGHDLDHWLEAERRILAKAADEPRSHGYGSRTDHIGVGDGSSHHP